MTAVLYAALGGPETTSDLYTINPSDGSETSVGPIGYAVTGMAYDAAASTMYAVTSNNSAANPRWLITIDLTTGAGTLIGPQRSDFYNCADIACNSAADLFGWLEGPDDLASIDKSTGLATVVGDSGFGTFGDGMSFDSHDVLYDMSRGSDGDLWTVDTSTGTPTTVATLSGDPAGGGNAIAAATFDSSDVLWAIVNGRTGNYHLVTVDTGSGAITDVGLMRDHMDALCWVGAGGGGPGRPTVTLTTPASGARYATGAVVNAAFVCTAGSGGALASCVGTVPNGSPIDTATAGTKTFSATATDTDAQTRTVTHTYQVGADPPTAVITTPPDGAAYYSHAVVNADFTCTAGGFGGVLASCAGDVANGSPIDTSTDGAHTFTVLATDTDGQSATVVHNYWVGPPEAPPPPTLITPPEGAVYAAGDAVLASYSCTPGRGGSLFSCFGTVANGHAIDTTPGHKTFRVGAQDYSPLYGYSPVTYTTHHYCVTGLGSALVPFDAGVVVPAWQLSSFPGAGYYIHEDYVYLSGDMAGSGPGLTRTLMQNLPAKIRPDHDVSITIYADPSATSDPANPALTIPMSWAATVHPDGTITLDDPVPSQLNTTPDPTYWFFWLGSGGGAVQRPQYTSPLQVNLNLGGIRWPMPGTTPPVDAPAMSSFAAYVAHGDFTDIDSTYAIHNERIHLGGRVQANIDHAIRLVDYDNPGLPVGSTGWANADNNESASTQAVRGSDPMPMAVSANPGGQILLGTDTFINSSRPVVARASPPVFDTRFTADNGRNAIVPNLVAGAFGVPTIDRGYTYPNPGEFYCITTGAFADPYYNYGNKEGTVPGFTFDVADLLALLRPTPTFFLVSLIELNVYGQHAQNSCVRGDTLFDGPAPGGPYPINDTEAYNGSFINAGPSIPFDPTLAITGSSLVKLDGTPFDPTTDSNCVNFLRYGGKGWFTPATPGFSGVPLIPSSFGAYAPTTYPANADASLWWTPDQATTITVEFPNLIIGGDGPNTTGGDGGPLPVEVQIAIEPLYALRQYGLRAGDVLDLTGAGWPGLAPVDCSAGFTLKSGTMTVGQAISGIRRRARKILGAFGGPVATAGTTLDTSTPLKAGGGTATGGGQGIVREQPCFGCGEQTPR